MHKVSLADKVFTENPLLDEIVYNAKQMATGVVLKDLDLANSGETLESIKNGDILIAIKNNTIHFSNFVYDKNFLLESGEYTNEKEAELAGNDNSLIPESIRDRLLKLACVSFMNNYVELNPYYRTLHGLPTYKYDNSNNIIWNGFWIDSKIIGKRLITLDDISVKYVNGFTLIHELDTIDKNIIFDNGVCYDVVSNTEWLNSNNLTIDDAMYLMHIGDREIDFYKARVADKFALLYCPPCSAEEVRSRFKDIYEANRLYLLYTFYQEAYKYRSEYYNNFMMIFLIIQTIIDMIIELPEYIIRRDIFDTRTCKYIFESNGVKYFRDIPLKYQIALVKNLNKLIKFKSTDKCIVDIISLFGIDNVEVFKYYIMKDRKINNIKNMQYYANSITEENSDGVIQSREDNDSNYDIRFIKVPMVGEYDDYIRKDSNIKTYESVIHGDASWQGDKYYDDVLSSIKNLDFTVLRSKYYSIEAVIDLAKKNFSVTYFLNMLLYNKVDCSNLLINLPNISTTSKFELVDTIITLYSIGYIYFGVEDTILDSKYKISQILGFNPEVDLAKIATFLSENDMVVKVDTDEEFINSNNSNPINPFKEKPIIFVNEENTTIKIKLSSDQNDNASFSIPKNNEILSFYELENLFLKNKNCYYHIREVLMNPPSKDIYDVYKILYNTTMITNCNMEYFLTENNDIVTEYKNKGYTTKFINIPHLKDYTNEQSYYRDMNALINSLEDNDLCFEIDSNFSENHLYNLYIKEDNKLKNIGTAGMAYTYREFLEYKDNVLYDYITSLISISDIDKRKEECVNAIQSITSYLKDYIDRDLVELDTVFSGLPSISLDFIKRYVEEVIDFFKSFKIFTHGSSIIYTIMDKFDNYVQIIDKALLEYLFDKSDIITIKDLSNKITSSLSVTEKIDLLNKIWKEITYFRINHEYDDFFNSTVYNQEDKRISEWFERVYTMELNDNNIPEINNIIDSMIKIISKFNFGKWTDKNGITHYHDTVISREELFSGSPNYIYKDPYNRYIDLLSSIILKKEMHSIENYNEYISLLNKINLNMQCFITDKFDRYNMNCIYKTDFNIIDKIYFNYNYTDEPNNRYDVNKSFTFNNVNDVNAFCNKYNRNNLYKVSDTDKLAIGNKIQINDGTYNKQWIIAGFDLEKDLKVGGFNYDNGYGILLIPDTTLGSNKWHENTSEGYVDSYMHQTVLPNMANKFKSILGNHLINRKVSLTSNKLNASNPNPNDMTTSYAYLTLMSICQLIGDNSNFDNGEANYKLPLFNHINPGIEGVRYWTRNIYSSIEVYCMNSDNKAYGLVSYFSSYVRPIMMIR